MNDKLKRTSLYDKHVDLSAKLVPFAGYEMPLQYEGVLKEHLAVRESVGMFDVSHMGEFMVSGDKAEEFLNNVTINDITKVEIGQAQYSVMCFEDGGIVDDLLIYKYDDRFMLVVNAANIKNSNIRLIIISCTSFLIRSASPSMWR